VNKRVIAVIALSVVATATLFADVTYHEPDQQYEKNMHRYGTGIKNWERAEFMRFTMADSYLFHYYAKVTADKNNKMSLKVSNTLDITKMMFDDIVPNEKISLYNIMRDRASVQSYVVMNAAGEIVAEDYWSNTNQKTKHHLMSANKSFSSMVAYIVADKGFFKLSDKAGKWVEELRGTPWADITLQEYSDMTSGIGTLLSSANGWGMPGGSTWDSCMSTAGGYNGLIKRDGKLLPPIDDKGDLRTLSDYVTKFAHNVKPTYKAGTTYEYRGLNTEILALAAERATGLNLSELMDKYLWSKGGFNSFMTMYVNQKHESLAAGSMNCTNRDFAIGSWIMGHGGKNWKGEQVIPEHFIEQIKNGDQKVKDAWAKVSYEHLLAPNAFYKNQWRTITDDRTGRTISVMVGVNGQLSAFDHKTGNVVALFGAYRTPTGQAMVNLYLFDIIFPILNKMDEGKSKKII